MNHVQVRRGTAALWASVNSTPLQGEICLETDTKQLKIGDGVTAYNTLPYMLNNSGVIGGKADKVAGATVNDIATLDATGNLLDSTKRFNDAGNTSLDVWSASQTITELNTKEPTISPKYSAFNRDFETSTGNIKMDSNTASLGSSNNVPRSDHIHPSDTTREPASTFTGGSTAQYFRGDKSWQTLDKTAVGLPNVTNDAQLKRAANDFTTFTATALGMSDVLLFEDASNAFTKGKVTIDDIASYGYYSAVADALTTTTSTAYQTKLTLSTPTIVAGTYAIFVSYTWYYTRNNRAFNAQVLVDGATVTWSTISIPPSVVTTNRYSASGFGIINFAANGTHTIALDYKSSNIADTAGIADARLLLHKIG